MPPLVREVLSSHGQPLDAATRSLLEPRFGHDFGQVRVHRDARAGESARAVNALAYTVGNHIVFQEGQYAPETTVGRDLLAHELAHVVQTGGRAPEGGVHPSEPESAAEQAARAAGARAAAGASVAVMRPAAPGLYRAPMTIPAVKKAIASKGHADITELAKLIPDSGNGKTKFKEVTIGSTKHILFLEMVTVQQSAVVTAFTGKNAETNELVTTQGTPPSQTITHTIRMTFPSNMIGDLVENVYHELVHARILIDKTLPEADRSDTYRRYAQLYEMATDQALLIVTGTTPKKTAVIEAIQKLRAGISVVPGFNSAALGPTTTDAAVYEFLINEKFTNKEASTVAGPKPLSSEKIAERYAAAVRGRFEEGLKGPAMTAYKASTIHGLVDDMETALKDAVVQLYRALDEQLKMIEDAKTKGIPGAVNQPSLPNMLPGPADLPAPVDISGNPIQTKSP